MSARALRIGSTSLFALCAGVLCGFAPASGGFVGSSPPPQVCSIYQTHAYRSDHIALAVNECWQWWMRSASLCTTTSVHTLVLDDITDSFVLSASDDQGQPGATKLAQNATQCAARHLTVHVARESIFNPGTWFPVTTYTVTGSWSASTSTCFLWTNWKSIGIPPGTPRVRMTAQAIRQDGSYAGTGTLGGYMIPGAIPPCWEP